MAGGLDGDDLGPGDPLNGEHEQDQTQPGGQRQRPKANWPAARNGGVHSYPPRACRWR